MIVLSGMKHCGKTTIGTLLAEKMELPFYDLDREMEKIFSSAGDIPVREIYKKEGAAVFKEWEIKALLRLIGYGEQECVLSLGGGTIENTEAVKILKKTSGFFIFLDVEEHILLSRILKGGIPPFLSTDDPEASFHSLYKRRVPLYKAAADCIIQLQNEDQRTAVKRIMEILRRHNGRQ